MDDFEDILKGKEILLREAYNRVVVDLKVKQDQLSEAYSRITLLQKDLEYNIDLISGRDAELKVQDAQLAALKVQNNERDRRISQLSLQLHQKTTEASNLLVTVKTQSLENDEHIASLQRDWATKLENLQNVCEAISNDANQERTALLLKVKGLEHEIKLSKSCHESELERLKAQMEANSTTLQKSFESNLLDINHQLDLTRNEAESLKVRNASLENDLKLERTAKEDAEHKVKTLLYSIKEQEMSFNSKIIELSNQHDLFLESESKRQDEKITNMQRAHQHEVQVLQKEFNDLEERNQILSCQLQSDFQRYSAENSSLTENVDKIQSELISTLQDLKIANANLEERDRTISFLKQQFETRSSEQQELLNISSKRHSELQEDVKVLKIELAQRIEECKSLKSQIRSEQLENEKRLDGMQYHRDRDSDRLIKDLLRENKELSTELQIMKANDDSHKKLKAENEELRDIVHQMRIDMEETQAASSEQQARQNSMANSIHEQQTHSILTDLKIKEQIIIQLKEKLAIAEQQNFSGNLNYQDLTSLQQENDFLREKLELASNEIQGLRKEKSKLIDMSNSLRAEIRQAAIKENENFGSNETLISEKLDNPTKKKPVLQSERATKSQEKVKEKLLSRKPLEVVGTSKPKIRNWNDSNDP